MHPLNCTLVEFTIMSALITPFVFKFPCNGQMQELTLLVQDDWVPMRPLVEALQMLWGKQRPALQKSGRTELVKFPGFRFGSAVCLTVPHVVEWLNGISLGRVKNPDLVRHFQQYFIPALESFVEDLNPAEPTPDIPPMYETELWEADKVADWLQQAPPIHIDTETDSMDHIRADLVAIGVRKYDELNYICRSLGLKIFKLNPDDPDGAPLFRSIMSQTYESGDLLKAKRAGWYPLPEFFRRHPHLYEQKVQHTQKIERNQAGHVVSVQACVAPSGMAPWYADDFAAEMRTLVEIQARVKDEQLRQDLAERLRAGEDVNAWLWDSANLAEIPDDTDEEPELEVAA